MKFTAGHAAFDASGLVSSEEAKEVFAHFGLAIHFANVLEHGVVNAVFVASLLPRVREFKDNEEWGRAIASHFEQMFSMTYGNMIQELRKTRAYSKSLIELLYKTKQTRDHLVHHFQRETADQMLTPDGRKQMIVRYQTMVDEFAGADDALEGEIAPIRRAHGATDDWLNKKFEEGMNELLRGPNQE